MQLGGDWFTFPLSLPSTPHPGQQAFVCLPAVGQPGLIQQVIGYLHLANWPTFIPLMLGPAHSIAPGEPGPWETLAHRVSGELGSGPLSASTELTLTRQPNYSSLHAAGLARLSAGNQSHPY
jgi:hypothetical protein